MEYIKLNNGPDMPVLGSGTNTFGKADRNYNGDINFDTSEIESAIKLGYRHFDTAISYRNEAVVALGLERSGLAREAFFLTSKIPGRQPYNTDIETMKQAIESSLENLNTSYIDLYLIHHPWDDPDGILTMWGVLESYVDSGKIRSIGVSNFDEKQLSHLLENGRIKPAVNQIESHPGHWNHEIITFCQSHGIVPVAWGPLGRTSAEAKLVLDEIGRPYDKTGAQVSLRYQLDRGVAVIPKSHNSERQAQNMDVFDFRLTPGDRARIAGL